MRTTRCAVAARPAAPLRPASQHEHGHEPGERDAQQNDETGEAQDGTVEIHGTILSSEAEFFDPERMAGVS